MLRSITTTLQLKGNECVNRSCAQGTTFRFEKLVLSSVVGVQVQVRGNSRVTECFST